MDVWARYTKTVGGGIAFDTDSATYHIAKSGATLCGRGHPRKDMKWELLRGRSIRDVNCKLCLKRHAKGGN